MGVEVRVEGLTKSFGGQPVWSDVSLTLPAGEISVLLGPSGTGKSVFLKTLVGLLKPDRGAIWIEGRDLPGSPSAPSTRSASSSACCSRTARCSAR
ncbi:hypothetical protein GCM10027615_58220 [Plantactinospora veratri]